MLQTGEPQKIVISENTVTIAEQMAKVAQITERQTASEESDMAVGEAAETPEE